VVGEDRDNRRWMSLAGMGVEFAGAVAGFCLLGYWIDHHWQIERHWGLLICAGLGVVGGLYNMIRQALNVSRSSTRRSEPDGRRTDDDA